jgi:ribosomal protein S18 acetylase RimI-like enzyme
MESHVSVNVRRLTLQDKPSVMAILRDTHEFKPVEVQVAEELMDCYLDQGTDSGYITLVAEVDSKVLGYVCYGPTPITEGTWDVYWMAVSRRAQRMGVGTALLSAVESDIMDAKGRLILIETSSKTDYVKAQNFYVRQGYELVSRIADFYEPGDDKLTYLKRIA